MSGLLAGWEHELRHAVAQIGPALSNQSVAGVFLGDELCGTANIPVRPARIFDNRGRIACTARTIGGHFGEMSFIIATAGRLLSRAVVEGAMGLVKI